MDETLFETATGTPIPTVTADEMREVDKIAVEEVGLELLQMMENAGRTLAEFVQELDGSDVTILAGNGGNGGGGLVAARHLTNRDVSVSVVLDRPPADLSGAAAHQYHILDAMDVSISVGTEDFSINDIVIDALIGYGLTGELHGKARDLVEVCNNSGSTIISLDVPSGLNATTGERLGPAIEPDSIVTLALPKTGLRDQPGAIFLADISIPVVVYQRVGIEYQNPFADRYLLEITAQ
jgi:NAD(P)H-hydrate epimerase